MSNSINQINQKISNLNALLGQGGGGGGGSQNLAQVLANGNDAGGLNITNLTNLGVTTINNAAYPPVVSTPTLSAVLTAGNTATNSISLNNTGIGTNVISLLPNASNDNPTITLTDGTITNTINKNGYTTRNTSENATHYLTFSDSASTGVGDIQKTSGISCNPSTNTITATTFNGNATNATAITITDTTDTDATYYPTFVDAAGTIKSVRTDTTGLTYNPFSNTLTTATFAGNASTATSTPNATNATNATNASTATAITITDNTATDATYYPTFVDAAGTIKSVRTDTTGLTYNPSTNTLTTATFAGNASTATSTPNNVDNADTGTNVTNVNTTIIPVGQVTNYKMTFVNATTGNNPISFDSNSLGFENDICRLTATTFNGIGTTADKVRTIQDNGTADTYLIPFKTEGDTEPFVNGQMFYNPSSNTLTATTFEGNASTATSTPNATNADLATNAGIATQVVTNINTANEQNYLTFVNTSTGSSGIRVNSTLLGYNPSTNTLTIGGDLTATNLILNNLPTSAPATIGSVWRDGTALKIVQAPTTIFQQISQLGRNATLSSTIGAKQSGAYGLIKLNIDYNGATIEIQKGVGGTRQDFYAQSTTTYGTDQLNKNANGTGQTLTAFLGADVGYVRTWYDQTGNGWNATGAAIAANPTLFPIYNKTLNRIDFGANGYFSLANSAYPSGNSPYSFLFTPLNNLVNSECIYCGGTSVSPTGRQLQGILAFDGALTYINVWAANNSFITTTPVRRLTNEKVADTYNGGGGLTGRSLFLNAGLTNSFTSNGNSANRASTTTDNYIGFRNPATQFATGVAKYTGALKYFIFAPANPTSTAFGTLSNADINILQNALSI